MVPVFRVSRGGLVLEDEGPLLETERSFPAWMRGQESRRGPRAGPLRGGMRHPPEPLMPLALTGRCRGRVNGQERGVGGKQGQQGGSRNPEVHGCREASAGQAGAWSWTTEAQGHFSRTALGAASPHPTRKGRRGQPRDPAPSKTLEMSSAHTLITSFSEMGLSRNAIFSPLQLV